MYRAVPAGREGKRVLLVTPQPFYEDRGTPIAVRYVLQALGELGHTTDLLAFPLGRTLELQNVRIHRTPNPLGFRSVPIGFSWKKAFLDLFLAQAMRRRLARERYDCIHAVEEAAWIATCIGRRTGVPVIYDMASSIPAHLSHRTPFRNPLSARVLRRLERRTLDRAAHVVCSRGLEDHVRRLVPACRVSVWKFPAPAPAPSAQAVGALRRELGIEPGAKVVLYAGSFADYQGLDVLFEAIPKVVERCPDVVFVCVGALEEEKARLEGSLDPPVRAALRIVPRAPQERIAAYLGLADFAVSTRSRGRNAPMKVYEYLAAGKPILASRTQAHERLLGDGKGLLFDHSGDALADALTALLTDPDRTRRLAASARAYADEMLSWKRYLRDVSSVYDAATTRRS